MTQNVDLDVGSLNIDQTMGKITAHVRKIEDAIRRSKLDSQAIGQNFDKGLGNLARQFNQSLSRLDQFEKTLLRFGRQGLKPGTFTQELQAANSAMDKLLVKKERLERNVGARGGTPSDYQRRQGELLNRQIADLGKLQVAFGKAQAQAQKFGIDGSASVGKINTLLTDMAAKLSSPRAFNIEGMLGKANTELAALQAQLARTGAAEELHTVKVRGQIAALRTVEDVEMRRVAAMSRIGLLQKRLATSTETQTQAIRRETAALKAEIEMLRVRDRELRRGVARTTGGGGGGVDDLLGRKPTLFGGAGGYSSIFADPRIYAGITAVAVGRQSLRFLAEFDDALHQLQAISGATSGQMESLRDTIADVGTSSKFSLVDLTKMATKLAQAGVSATQMGEALAAASTLATASGSSPDEAVDLVTASMGAFQLQAEEATRTANLFTAALNETRLTVNQGALAIQYVGASARQQGITLEETLATAAALSQAGIRSGSTIGTGFRQFLVDLQSPSKKLQSIFEQLSLTEKDLDISTRGLVPVLESLRDAGFGSALAYEGLETRAGAFYLTAASNTDLMEELQLQMLRMGQAAKANEAAMGSLSAQWQRFKNIIGEDFSSGLDTALDIVRDILKGLSDALVQYKKLSEEARRHGLPSFGESFSEGTRWSGLPGFLLSVVSTYREVSETARDVTEEIAENDAAFSAAQSTYRGAEQAIQRLVKRQAELPDGSRAVRIETERLTQRFPGLINYLDLSTNSVNNLTNALGQLAAQQARTLAGAAGKQISLGMEQLRGGGRGLGGLYSGVASGLILDPEVIRLVNKIQETGGTDQLYSLLLSAISDSNDVNVKPYLGAVSDVVGGRSAVRQGRRALDRAKVMQTPEYQTALQESLQISANLGKNPGSQVAFEARMKAKAEAAATPTEASLWMELSRSVHGAMVADQVDVNSSSSSATRRAQRSRERTARLGVRTAKRSLRTAVSDLKRAVDQETYDAAVEAAKDARDELIEDLKEQAAVDASDMSADEAKARWLQFQDDREHVLEEFDNDLFDSIQNRFQSLMETANNAYEAALAEDARRGGIPQLEGAIAGLNLFSARDTPDFVRQLAENRLARSQEALLPGQLASTRSKILAQGAALDGMRLDQAKYKPGDIEYVNLAKQIEEANTELLKLYDTAARLQATIDAVNLVPTTLGEGLDQAIDAYVASNNIGRTWNEEILANMTGALGQAHESLTTFFSDILTGSRTVLGAFGNLAKGIINYLQQMAAQFIANKVFGAILGLIGGTPVNLLAGTPYTGNAGGIVKANSGHYITEGVPDRDTVPALLSKGEFVVRKRAVDELGPRFMSELNARGAKALQGMGSVALPRPANQMMNVYVVAPEQQPSLGPDDVKVVIAQDILEGGVTKKLIVQAAQGG